ncbi:MAG: hypothetical protein WKF35_05215 [Ferruginibacter sp.]
MKQVISVEKDIRSTRINRTGYILFLLLVLFLITKGDYDWAIANMGIGLIFDPFSPAKWEERSRSQKAVLLIHLSLLFAGAFLLFFGQQIF